MGKFEATIEEVTDEKGIKGYKIDIKELSFTSLEEAIGILIVFTQNIKKYINRTRKGLDKLLSLGMIVDAVMQVIKGEILECEESLEEENTEEDFSEDTQKELSAYLEKCFQKDLDNDN